jgi:hypothetical protein
MLSNKLNKKGQVVETKNWKFLSSSIFPKTRKGQVAETVTWVVATMIIILILIVSIFISVSLSKAKELSISGVVSKVGSFFISEDAGEISRLDTKTKLAISINEKDLEVINDWIKK